MAGCGVGIQGGQPLWLASWVLQQGAAWTVIVPVIIAGWVQVVTMWGLAVFVVCVAILGVCF